MASMSRRSLINIDFHGAEDLQKALRDIGKDKTIRTAMRKHLRKATEPTLQMAKNNAPVETGRMKDGIALTGVLSRRQRRGGNYSEGLGENTVRLFLGAKPRGPGVLSEFGTGPRYTKKGKFTGAAPAQPFLRPAWEADKYNVLDRFSRSLGPAIERAARRANKKKALGK